MPAATHHEGRTPCPADRAACPRCCGSMFPLAVSYVASVSHSSYSIMNVSSCVLLGMNHFHRNAITQLLLHCLWGGYEHALLERGLNRYPTLLHIQAHTVCRSKMMNTICNKFLTIPPPLHWSGMTRGSRLLGSHIANFFILQHELPVMRYVSERLVVLTLERLGLVLGMYEHHVLPCRSARAPMYILPFHLNIRNTLRRVLSGNALRDPCSIGNPTRSSSCRHHRVSRLYGSRQRNKSYPAPLTPLANSLSTTSSFR